MYFGVNIGVWVGEGIELQMCRLCTMHVIRTVGIIGEKMLTFIMSEHLWSHMGFIELSTV